MKRIDPDLALVLLKWFLALSEIKELFSSSHSMKTWMVVIALVFAGCGAIKNYTLCNHLAEDIGGTRELKILALIDKNGESRLQEYERTLITTFKEFSKEVGITTGSVRVETVDLDGTRSLNQVYQLLFTTLCPRGPKAQDVTLLYSTKIFAEDLASLLMAGSVKLGGRELVFQRFMVLRSLSVRIAKHELGHVFGADDRKYPDENRQIILSMKWRRFDGWYMRNGEKEIPMLKSTSEWGTEEVMVMC